MTKKIDKSTIVNGLIERFNLYLELAEENPNFKIEWLSYADEVATIAMYQGLLTLEEFNFIADGIRELKYSAIR